MLTIVPGISLSGVVSIDVRGRVLELSIRHNGEALQLVIKLLRSG